MIAPICFLKSQYFVNVLMLRTLAGESGDRAVAGCALTQT